MKKALSLILAIVMALSLTVPAFAETDNSTDITLTVAKSLTYDMVIPEDVTNLNAAGIYSVGRAKVANVKNATDNTVISYTATTTAFKCDGKTDIPASYYTDEAGQNAFPTTAVEVYISKADAENIPTMYVGISESDWNAAENGTYTATVTYNFSAEEVGKVTIADILPDGFPDVYDYSWWRGSDSESRLFVEGDEIIARCGEFTRSVPVTTELTPAEDSYTCTVSVGTWTFTMGGKSFSRVDISGYAGSYGVLNGEYVGVG